MKGKGEMVTCWLRSAVVPPEQRPKFERPRDSVDVGESTGAGFSPTMRLRRKTLHANAVGPLATMMQSQSPARTPRFVHRPAGGARPFGSAADDDGDDPVGLSGSGLPGLPRRDRCPPQGRAPCWRTFPPFAWCRPAT